MSIIMWIIFGALVGWISSLIMSTDAEQGAIANIVIGIIGAFIGGALSQLLGGPSVTGFNLTSIVVAILGAVILTFFVRMIGRGRHSAT